MKNYHLAIATLLTSFCLTACDAQPTNKTDGAESPAPIQTEKPGVINVVVEDYVARGILDRARQLDKRLATTINQMDSLQEETFLTTPSNEDIDYVLQADAPIRESYQEYLMGIVSKAGDKVPRKVIDSFQKVIEARTNSFHASDRLFRALIAYREAVFHPIMQGHMIDQRMADMAAARKAFDEMRTTESTAMTSFNAARDEVLAHHPDWVKVAELELKKRLAALDQAIESKKSITPASPPRLSQQIVRPVNRPQPNAWQFNPQSTPQPNAPQYNPRAARQAQIDAAVARSRVLNEERQAQDAAAVGAGTARGLDRATDIFTPPQSRVRR